MAKKSEKQVADAILQREMSVEVEGVAYKVAPPSIATLIMVSELVAQMPEVDINSENTIKETLRMGRHCAVVGEILATLILGAKKIRKGDNADIFRFFRRRTYNGLVERLANELLVCKTPSELSELTVKLLKGMEVTSFFSIIAFLSGVNILKPTREVETTALGQ